MHVSWLGLSAVKLETASAVVVTDPFAPSAMAKPLRAKADIVTVSAPGRDTASHVRAISGTPFVIETPGEFEVRGIYLRGLPVQKTIVYLLEAEGLRLAHFGHAATVPSDETLEAIGSVDLLFVPVGGGVVYDAADALAVVNALEPRVVVPLHFALPGLTLQEKLQPVAPFLREIGASGLVPVERATVKKRDLKEEETTVLLLNA